MNGVPKLSRATSDHHPAPEILAPAVATSLSSSGEAVRSERSTWPEAGATPPANGSPQLKSSRPPGENGANSLAPAKAKVSGDLVAVLELGDAGQILAAREACTVLFGWESLALAGQNVRVLLKGGLDNEVGRFLIRHREGTRPAQVDPLRVIVLRRDGTEYHASISTLAWSWDATLPDGSVTSRLKWTAAVRKHLDKAGLPAGGVTTASPEKTEPRSSTEAEPVTPKPARQEKAVSLPVLAETPQAKGGKADDTKPVHHTAHVEAVPSGPPTRTTVQHGVEEAGKNERGKSFEKELAELRRERDELKSQLTSGDLVVEEFKLRIGALEEQLRKSGVDLEGVRADADARQRQQCELRSQVAAAEAAAAEAKAALHSEVLRREKLEERLQNLSSSLRQEQAERSKRFEAEQIKLRQERDELDRKLAEEQRAATESTQRAQELESRLAQNDAEVERAKSELEKQEAERERSESAWREQLDTAFIKKKEVEGAWAGEVERNKRFEEELAGLRREHDELQARLAAEQQVALESQQRAKEVESRLGKNATEFDRAQAELAKKSTERERSESEWREQLDAANAVKTQLETALTEARAHNKRFDEELAALRRERDELQGKLKGGQHSTASAERKMEELLSRLDKNTAELKRAKEELQEQNAAREQAESNWREQLKAAKVLANKVEADSTGATERITQLDEELTSLRQERDELTARLKTQLQATTEPARRAEDLEHRLDQTAAKLERALAELEKRSAERERWESDWRTQAETSKAESLKIEEMLAEARETNRRLESELASLECETDEPDEAPGSVEQTNGASANQVKEKESSQAQSATDLELVRAELEKAARRLPAQVLQYDFDRPNGQPVRKTRRAVKRRAA